MSEEKVKTGSINADFPSETYSEISCTIGYSYLRFEVTGSLAPCCIAKHPIGDFRKKSWKEVWHTGSYEAFRRKMERISEEKFHLHDPEWSFCQQCSHLPINIRNSILLNEK